MITVSKDALRFEKFDSPEELRVFEAKTLPGPIKWIAKRFSPRTHKVNFLFKPSGAVHFVALLKLTEAEGFQMGYDVMEENKVVFFSVPE